jgi:hypothetical protein
MEGRHPPPPGVHPFPDDVAAINKKFWGTPLSRGLFKYCFCLGTIWMSTLFINYYFTKDDPKFLGIDATLTEEQFEQRKQVLQSHPAKKNIHLPVMTVQNLFVPEKNQPEGYDMRFDDSVKISPNHVMRFKRQPDESS